MAQTLDPRKIRGVRRGMGREPQKSPNLFTIDKVMAYLNQTLRALDRTDGAVRTLVVYDGHGKINCYGYYLDAIFITRLNMNHSTKGTKTTCHISYPLRPTVKPSFEKGFFVKASTLGVTAAGGQDYYLAFVNFKAQPDPNSDSEFDQDHDFLFYQVTE